MDLFFLQQKGIRQVIGYGIVGAYALSVLVGFYLFAPLAFGFDYPSSQLEHLRWISTWHFSHEA